MKTAKQISLPKLLAKTQKVFNAWVRNRDREKGCVSCKSGKVEQASHFYSAGKHSALRFTEDNCHGACVRCNYFLSGNLLPYRATLLKRIGQQRLDILEATATRRAVHKWSRFELEQIIKKYSCLD